MGWEYQNKVVWKFQKAYKDSVFNFPRHWLVCLGNNIGDKRNFCTIWLEEDDFNVSRFAYWVKISFNNRPAGKTNIRCFSLKDAKEEALKWAKKQLLEESKSLINQAREARKLAQLIKNKEE